MPGGFGKGISLFSLGRIQATAARREFATNRSTSSSGDAEYRNYPADWPADRDVVNFGAVGAIGPRPAAFGDGTYIDGTITGGIGLTGTPQSPVTITAEGYVLNNTAAYGGDAVYGTSAAVWSIHNLGTVQGNPTLSSSNGIRLESSGVVTNGQSGSTGALIAGSATALRIEGTGSVSNFGTIAGTGESGSGIFLAGGGSVGNAQGALISGIGGGVAIAGAGGATVSNLGTIAGSGTAAPGLYPVGIYIGGAGTVVNGAADAVSALISGSYTGIRSTGSSAAITNFGTIAGGISGSAIRLFNSGTVSNAAGGLISGAGDGIAVSSIGTISNFGTISATGTASTAINLAGGGTIANGAGGVVAGGFVGVGMSNAASTAVNYGTIRGGRLGIGIFADAATVSNFGTIEATDGYAQGVYLSGGGRVENLAGALIAGALVGLGMAGDGGATGTVSNFGTIAGTSAVADGIRLSGGHVANAAGALISAASKGIAMAGAAASTVSNFGTIAGTGTFGGGLYPTGIYIDGVATVVNGATDTASALISGVYAGVRIEGAYAATVANFGTIRATGSFGAAINVSGGSVSNAQGALIAGADGVLIRQNGTGAVSNLGTIRATATAGSGIVVAGGGDVANASGGLIVGGYAGIRMAGGAASTVGNSGAIIAGRRGIFIYGTAPAAVANFGTIAATGSDSLGVYIAGAGAVVNGATDATSALIAGVGRGVHIESDAATVNNYGTIAGTGIAATGVVLSGGGKVGNAQSGRIMGDQLGVVMTGAVTSTVTNLGTIAAATTEHSLYARGVYMTGAGTVINGAVSAASALISAAFAGVSINVGYNAATVANYGTIVGTGASAGGIHLSGQGRVSNMQGALISGARDGVLISGSGSIGNFGTIRGVSSYGSGIGLAGGGSVANGLTGLISGGYTGVRMYGIGASTVVNHGSIAGDRFGINIYADTATVDNFGTVAGLGGAGIYMKAGAVANGAATATSALITGLYTGVSISGTAAASVSNFGTIAGTGTFSAGIALSGGGNIGNVGGALISGGHLGVIMAGAASTVANLGTIVAAAGSDLYPIGIVIGGTGTVINGAADAALALITAAHVGIQIAGSDAGTVANYGTILGTGTYGTGIKLQGGGVDNAQGALISGMRDGVYILNTGAVSNFGAIRGGVDGIEMYGPDGLVANFATIAGLAGAGIDMRGGAVVNGATDATSALITGLNNGVVIYGTAAAAVTNFGTIEATGTDSWGIVLSGGGSVSNVGGALISGDRLGVLVWGYAAGAVSNSGIIRGAGAVSTGIQMGGGSVINGQGGLISGTFIGVALAGAAASTVGNYGTITGGSFGIEIFGAGGAVDNFGRIEATDNNSFGVYLSGGDVRNLAGALITGSARGVQIFGDLASNVSNYGTILATGTDGRGIYLSGGGTVSNAFTGLISGVDVGIQISGTIGTATNYGNVVATQTGGIGIRVDIGAVTNFGTVIGGENGIGVYVGNGNVVSSGTIAAAGPFGRAVVVQEGTFINYGLVQGAVYGLELTPTAGSGGSNVNVSGTVVGATGISAASPAGTSQTVTVAGSVSGTSGLAVSLTPGGSDRLILEPGAAFLGAVDGGGGASVLQVAGPEALASARFGFLANNVAYVDLNNIVNFTTLQIDPSATASTSGVLSFSTLVNQGQIIVAAGDSLAFGTVLGAANTGIISVHAGGLVRFQGGVANQRIDFNTPGGTAIVDHPELFSNTVTITDFETGDTIALALGRATDPYYANQVLTLSYGGFQISLTVTTPYIVPLFLVTDDGTGGTNISVMPAPPPVVTEALVVDSGSSPTDGVTSNPLVGGLAVPGLAVTLTEGGTIVGSIIADGSGAWAILPVGLPDGSHTLVASQTDAAGNTGTATVSFVLDTTVPSILVDNGLSVSAGATATITASLLSVSDNTGPVQLTYVVTSGPSHGTLLNNGQATTAFTQADIDSGAIAYRNSGAAVSDDFSFTVSDAAGNATNGAFHIALAQAPRATRDFDGSGTSDILWHHSSTNSLWIYEMDGTQQIGGGAAGLGGAGWDVGDIGDFNGDGNSDILWHHTDTNGLWIYEMDGTQQIGGGAAGQGGPGWDVVGSGDTGSTTAAVTGGTQSSDAAFGFADISDNAAAAPAAASVYDAMPPPSTGAPLWLPQTSTVPVACLTPTQGVPFG